MDISKIAELPPRELVLDLVDMLTRVSETLIVAESS